MQQRWMRYASANHASKHMLAHLAGIFEVPSGTFNGTGGAAPLLMAGNQTKLCCFVLRKDASSKYGIRKEVCLTVRKRETRNSV